MSDAVDAAAALVPRLAAAAATTDREGAFPTEAIAWLRAAGLLAAPLDAAHGGQGLGDPARLSDLLRTLRHIGRGDLSVGRLYEGHVDALGLVRRLGTPAQIGSAAGDAVAGHLFGIWNTQGAPGVRLARHGTGTDARLALTGRKIFASGAGHVTRALVTAQDDAGRWQLLMVPTDATSATVDVAAWRPLGLRSTASGEVDFSGIALPPDSTVGAGDDYLREPWFSAGAIRFVAVQVGGAEAVLDATRRLLRDFGRADDPYQRQRLGEMATLVEGAAHWLDAAARRHAGHARLAVPAAGDAALVAYVHMARGAVETACLRVMQLAERCVGPRGLLAPQPLERLHRDLTIYLRQPAPDAAEATVGRHALVSERPAHGLWDV